jgi:hypothetical protein
LPVDVRAAGLQLCETKKENRSNCGSARFQKTFQSGAT